MQTEKRLQTVLDRLPFGPEEPPSDLKVTKAVPEGIQYMELYKELHDSVKVRRMEGIEEIGKQLKELKEMEDIILITELES